MIDIEAIRKDPERYKKAARDKGVTVDIERLLILDKQIRYTKGLLQRLAQRKNALQKAIPNLTGAARLKAVETLRSFKSVELLIRKGLEAYTEYMGLLYGKEYARYRISYSSS